LTSPAKWDTAHPFFSPATIGFDVPITTNAS
jgi:hypothetical protein